MAHRFTKMLRSPHLWVISAMFFACLVLHYLPQLQFLPVTDLNARFGFSRHAVERIFFLFPVIYTAIVFGLTGGVVALGAAVLSMLPRAAIYSPSRLDALFETGLIIGAGVFINYWIESKRRESGRREQALLKLEAVRRELQSYIGVIKENERRLSALHAISSVVNRSLMLEQVAQAAVAKVMQVMGVDVTLIFVLEKDARELKLIAYQGISDGSAGAMDKLALGEGFNGWVAQRGEPLVVEDSASDERLARDVVLKEGLRSQFIVPLKSRDEVVGTLCIGMRSLRQFTTDEKELLGLIGIELGVAIEKARLYQESQRAMKRFQELFEKAHDAIWVQDAEGVITAANRAAAAITGYDIDDLMGRNVSEFLSPPSLSVSREVKRKLCAGENIPQPYDLRIIRKEGTEAILKLTTSLLGEKDAAPAFQHIARDVTQVRQLWEDLQNYIHQITTAHEEERARIARELHDESVQSLVAISHRLDSLASEDKNISPETLKGLETVRKDVDASVAAMRHFIQDLRPPSLDYLGLFPALRELIAQVRKEFGLEAVLEVKGQVRELSKREELLIYRIAQEALRNVGKHAKATRVEVLVEAFAEKTTMTISDNGRGFRHLAQSELAKKGSLGLIGMEERARLLGGTLTVRSEPNSGTTIILDIPGRSELGGRPESTDMAGYALSLPVTPGHPDIS